MSLETGTNTQLRKEWFNAPDGEVYFLDGVGKTPTLAITRGAHNPILKHIDDAFEQLTTKSNYRPHQADVQQALTAPDTVLIALPNLRLSKHDSEFSFLTLGTTPAKFNKLNDEERKLAERIYDQRNDFVRNMKMLKRADIGETLIYVLNPDYVQKHAAEGAIARGSWLFNFYGNSQFNAHDRIIFDLNLVNGVRMKYV